MSDIKLLAENYLTAAKRVGGCSDGGCVVIRPTGQHTNGRCRCTLEMDAIRQRGVRNLLMMAQRLATTVLEDRHD